MTAGERVRRWRNHKGWTLQQMAEAAGLDPSTLSRIENGIRKFHVEHLERICSVLGVSEAEFYALTPTPPPPGPATAAS